MRPFFPYFGSKWKLVPRYPAPEHATIVEPFAGSAGYATRYSDREVILVERDPVVASLWRWLVRVSVDEVVALPLDPSERHGLCEPAKSLIGFWCARGRTRPANTHSTRWLTCGKWPHAFWGEYVRARIAEQVQKIRHWRIIEGDYSKAPDVEATWFIDPPYEGATHYAMRVGNYRQLGRWCRQRRGLSIVCEADGADWLPFRFLHATKSVARKRSVETVWLSDNTC